ncbi:cellulose biosynthesis protein BcsN [Methylobacterium terrae]|uniref:cellulose biosynthesis protein BcsN n=1 Tax=Methylobacterium terrae TaxID=2202827 RepID=UPI0013A54D56|nr:cellulose biosynthesis protein BcsN [Methylobacterium terrae]
MIRPLVLAAAALALAACTAQERPAGPLFASLDASLPPAPVRRARATPVVVLPAWIGRPVALRERDGPGGFEQALTLAAPGRSGGRDDLVLVSSPRAGALDAALGGKPTEAGIRAEIAAAFPGVAMQVVTRPSSNAYGPYGLAVGRAGAARCLYAWQWIAEAPLREGGAPAPLSLRVRLCRDDLTVEAMAASVSQLRLVPRFAGEPVAAPATAGSRPARRVHRQAPPASAPAPAFAAAPPEPAPSGPRYLGAEGAPRGPVLSGGTVRNALLGTLDAPSSPTASLPPDAAILPPEATRGPAAPRP